MGFDPRWAEKMGAGPADKMEPGLRTALVQHHAEARDTDLICWAVEQAGFGKPQSEFRFHQKRKWRFDFAWPDLKVALEREGSAWVDGRLVSRHRSDAGYASDCEKYNAAGVAGWLVVRATPPMLKDGRALAALLEALSLRTGEPPPDSSRSGKASS